MIHFRNPGSLDIRALTTFGLSSKDGVSTIGRFGTGLKYATAVILRHGGEIIIKAGGCEYRVSTRTEDFRGKEVKQAVMNGADLPFTTELGRDWEPWMAFRELYSNALDEGGDVSRGEGEDETCGEETVVSVRLDAFEAIFFSMEEHFISRDEAPLWVGDGIEVYPGRSLFVFYRGIAIMKLKEPAALRYNLLGHIDLTEDRTAKYDWQIRARIAQGLAKASDGKVVAAAADQRNDFEASLDYSTHNASEQFLGAAVALGANCNPTAMALVRAKLPASADQCTIVSASSPGGDCLIEALRSLRAIGADLSKCKFVLAAGVPFYGDYDVRGDAVFINEAVFDRQERMTLACIEGYAEVVGSHWLAKTLLDLAREVSL